MVNLLFGLLFLSCILTVTGNKTGSCQKFCELFASNEDVLNHNENNKTEYNEYEWCNNIVLRPLADDPLQFPKSVRVKFVFKFDEVKLAREREMGFLNYVKKVQHIIIDHSIPNDNGIVISLSFHEKTDIIDRSFVCPIFEEDKSFKKRSPLYCYYRLPKENESTFLSSDKIPERCDRIIIRGADKGPFLDDTRGFLWAYVHSIVPAEV